MKILFFTWTFNGAVSAIVLSGLVLFLMFCYFIFKLQALKKKLVEHKKKRARKVLSEEIEELNNNVKYYQEKYLGKQNIILSKSIVYSLIDMLPSANEAFHSPMVLKKCSVNNRINTNNFEFRVIEFYPEVSISIKILPLNIVVNIIHRKDNMSANIMGVNVNVDSFVWDFGASGIRIISDEEFNMLCNFTVSSHKVANETGLLDYKK